MIEVKEYWIFKDNENEEKEFVSEHETLQEACVVWDESDGGLYIFSVELKRFFLVWEIMVILNELEKGNK